MYWGTFPVQIALRPVLDYRECRGTGFLGSSQVNLCACWQACVVYTPLCMNACESNDMLWLEYKRTRNGEHDERRAAGEKSFNSSTRGSCGSSGISDRSTQGKACALRGKPCGKPFYSTFPMIESAFAPLCPSSKESQPVLVCRSDLLTLLSPHV